MCASLPPSPRLFPSQAAEMKPRLRVDEQYIEGRKAWELEREKARKGERDWDKELQREKKHNSKRVREQKWDNKSAELLAVGKSYSHSTLLYINIYLTSRTQVEIEKAIKREWESENMIARRCQGVKEQESHHTSILPPGSTHNGTLVDFLDYALERAG